MVALPAEWAACAPWPVHQGPAAALTAALAQDIAARLRAAIAQRGQALLCVPGGQSPVPLFQALRRQPLDWARVRVTLTDERCVPPTHPASNARLVRTQLLQDGAAAADFVPLVAPTDEPLPPPAELAAAAAQRVQAAGAPDVLVLGMGEDGHMASLFAQASNLAAALDPRNASACVAVELAEPPPNAPYARVSQTLAQLLRARHIVLPLAGAAKLATLQRACRAVDPRWPISHVLHQHGTPVELWLATESVRESTP